MTLFRILNQIILISGLLIFSSCKGKETIKEVAGDGSTLIFSGISSIDETTDTTLQINWTPHADAVAYHVFDTTSGSTLITTVSGQASSSTVITGLTPNQLYSYRVTAMNADGVTDSNVNDVSVTTNLAPDVPNALTLLAPTSSPNFSSPTITVGGVKNGDTVTLYKDSACTLDVATGVATGSTIDLAISPAYIPDTYTLYANATNSVPTSSACSTATVTYVKVACPTGYIPVAANSDAGTTNDFCVMKYEAKNVAAVATSQPTVSPWVSLTQPAAKTACTNLGAGYDLISNPEWMTIAYDIEATASNWSGGTVGAGALFRGHTDNSPASALAISDTSNYYVSTGNTSAQAMGAGKEQKRILTLSNDEIIWDFSGNVQEWTDWTLGGALDLGPLTCLGAWTEMPNVSCGALAAADYLPANPAAMGVGQFYGATGGATLRGGGSWGSGISGGIFFLSFYYDQTATATYFGFRCVYRQ